MRNNPSLQPSAWQCTENEQYSIIWRGEIVVHNVLTFHCSTVTVGLTWTIEQRKFDCIVLIQLQLLTLFDNLIFLYRITNVWPAKLYLITSPHTQTCQCNIHKLGQQTLKQFILFNKLVYYKCLMQSKSVFTCQWFSSLVKLSVYQQFFFTSTHCQQFSLLTHTVISFQAVHRNSLQDWYCPSVVRYVNFYFKFPPLGGTMMQFEEIFGNLY